MDLERVSILGHNKAVPIYRAMSKGYIKKYIDEYGYLCYDKEELDKLKPKKRGRKPKI